MTLQNKFVRDYRKLFRLLQSGTVFTAFDTETTGLKAENDRIIEIGAIKFNKDGVLGRFNTLINPQITIPSHITAINHIDDSMVQDKPLIKEVLPKFLKFLGDSTIVGHNIQFDLRFLQAESERLGINPITNFVIDTLQLSRWTYPELGQYKQAFLAERLGIPVTEAHRAYDDAYVCGGLFLRCIQDSADKQKF